MPEEVAESNDFFRAWIEKVVVSPARRRGRLCQGWPIGRAGPGSDRVAVALSAGIDTHPLMTRYNRHRSGTPFSSCSPASLKTRPLPATRSFTVLETSTSPAPASPATRAPMCTARPRTVSPASSTSPVCTPRVSRGTARQRLRWRRRRSERPGRARRSSPESRRPSCRPCGLGSAPARRGLRRGAVRRARSTRDHRAPPPVRSIARCR
jgi:hypothetical protein